MRGGFEFEEGRDGYLSAGGEKRRCAITIWVRGIRVKASPGRPVAPAHQLMDPAAPTVRTPATTSLLAWMAMVCKESRDRNGFSAGYMVGRRVWNL